MHVSRADSLGNVSEAAWSAAPISLRVEEAGLQGGLLRVSLRLGRSAPLLERASAGGALRGCWLVQEQCHLRSGGGIHAI